jgi:tetratricopeptide (TPR) repeat protein
MSTEELLTRARLLLAQKRFQQAEQVLREVLISQPDNWLAYACLALSQCASKTQLPAARQSAEQAVHLAPDEGYSHYILGLVRYLEDDHQGSLASVAEAIRLDPQGNSNYYWLQSQNYLVLEKWDLTAAAAEAGLHIEPADDRCSFNRSLALERLGRTADALAEAERSVQNDPDSAQAHASRGWALLNRGNAGESQIAFREALRLDPQSEFARAGMIRAINSQNLFYRLISSIMLRISRLTSSQQLMVIFGFWLLLQALPNLTRKFPALEPWTLALVALLILFAISTWLYQPLFNALLRLHPFGRHLLDPQEKLAANLTVGVLLSGAALATLSAIVQRDFVASIIILIHSAMLSIPIAMAFEPRPPAQRWLVAIVASLFGALLAVNVGLLLQGRESLPWLQAYSYGIMIFCVVGPKLFR